MENLHLATEVAPHKKVRLLSDPYVKNIGLELYFELNTNVDDYSIFFRETLKNVKKV